jgi:hypothetical protein
MSFVVTRNQRFPIMSIVKLVIFRISEPWKSMTGAASGEALTRMEVACKT